MESGEIQAAQQKIRGQRLAADLRILRQVELQRAELRVAIGADGKPGEIAVARPIGFGLDENAVDSIRKATFEPAIKNGNPVPVMLDLVVEFRIYSNRTAVTGNPSQQPAAAPSLPGPYSTQQPQKNP